MLGFWALIDYTKENHVLSTLLLELSAPLVSHVVSIRTQTQFLQRKAGTGEAGMVRHSWRSAFGSCLAGTDARQARRPTCPTCTLPSRT